MAYEIPGLCIPLLAAADLSAYQYRGVKVTANNTVNLSGDGEFGIGILQDAPAAAGRAGSVMVNGVSKAVYGATVSAAGTKLATNAAGKFIPAVAGKHVTALALESGAADEIHPVLILHTGAAPTPYV